ncbi:MAG: hypothetical protein HQK60_06850 [Deltaproteobacteria bacterium]|nr:hypothetical protein [Deltaproteobacteria bacterium]
MDQNSGTVRWIYISLGLTFAICLVATYWFRNFTLDDALIYHRYIQNALEGKGLVYNQGEKFNGLTSPLYSYITLLISWLVNDVTRSQVWLSGACLFATCLVLARLFRQNVIVAMTLPLLVATSRYFYTTFGLETTWFLFLTVLAIQQYEKNKYGLLGVVCSCLLLTRGESVFLVLVLTARHFLERRPFPRIRLFIIPGLILAAHYTFTYWYYGKLLPSTLAAKVYQGKSGLWGDWPCFMHVAYLGEWVFDNCSILMVGVIGISLVGLVSGIRNRTLVTLLVFTLAWTGFYICLNIPNYHWYYSVNFLLLYTGVAFGLDFFWRLFSPAARKIGFPIHQVGLGLMIVLLVGAQFLMIYTHGGRHGGVWHYMVIGRWIEQRTAVNSSVACVEIGHIGWYSKRKIIDILGLVNPHNARLIGERKFGHWLKYYRPDYILTHNPPWPAEQGMPQLVAAGLYTPDNRFDFPGFSLFAKQASGGTRE